MSFVQYRNKEEFKGYETGSVFRLLFLSKMSSVQLGTEVPPGVCLFNQSTAQLIHVTHEEFADIFQPASWEWVPEMISLKEQTHKIKIGWLVKKKEVTEYNAEFWHHPLKVVGFHQTQGVYAKAYNGGAYHIPKGTLSEDFDITPLIEENE